MAKILVADDVPMMRDLLSTIMINDGHDVIQASNGEQVLDQIESQGEIDLVLCDIAMPGMDGIEAITKLRKMGSNFQGRICYVSGSRDKELVMRALKSGGDDYIVKPVDKTILLDKVHKLLGHSGQSLAKIDAQCKAHVTQMPVALDLMITEISEIHLKVLSPLLLKKDATLIISVPKFDEIFGMKSLISIRVESVVEKEMSFECSCRFVGMHEEVRSKIRSMVIRNCAVADHKPTEKYL